MGHLVDVRNVYKIYNPGENQVNALDGVSLTIDEGEFVAIIGQSGSGKSTFMNMLGLLDTPTEGEYYINGKLVDDLTDDEMSVIRNEEIGFIFQGFNLISSLTALENVELPLVYRGMLKDEGRTVIVITHDNEIAMEAERVVRIRDGRIVEDYINPGFEEKYGRKAKYDNANPIDLG